jgi:hypothetical protein
VLVAGKKMYVCAATTSTACWATNREARFSGERYIGEGRLRLQEIVGSCCCMYNTRVRRAKCLLSKMIINHKSTCTNEGILPKSNPGRAVKPAARQPAERGQTVS